MEDASAVHLINPVDLALSTWHPNEIVSLNQHTSGTARVDKCWLRRIPGGTRPFAALDYKKAGVIREDEYQEALRDPANYQQLANHAWGTDSSFTGNSAILLKQGVNYANQYETKYIAFFDWNSLLLLVLTDQEGTSGGMWCYATLVRDRAHMRRALLGFLERAYRASVAGSEVNLAPQMPYVPVGHIATASGLRRGRSGGLNRA